MKNNKKGFTLLEMLAVIAIIAILVAITIPILTGKTDKAAAATNAANLRSVEGQLLSMMLLEPDRFNAALKAQREQEIDTEVDIRENYVDPGLQVLLDNLSAAQKYQAELEAEVTRILNNLDQEVADAQAAYDRHEGCSTFMGRHIPGLNCIARRTELEAKKLAQANPEAATKVANAAVDAQKLVVQECQNAVDNWNEQNQTAIGNLKTEKDGLYKYECDEEGWITLDDGTKIQFPLSEKVKIDDVDCPKGVPMNIYLDAVRREFTAEYQTYDKNDFARVADEK